MRFSSCATPTCWSNLISCCPRASVSSSDNVIVRFLGALIFWVDRSFASFGIWELARITSIANLIQWGTSCQGATTNRGRCDGLGEEHQNYGSHPLKSALFVQPQIPDEQDSEKHDHRNQSEQPLVRRDPPFVQNRPGNEEHRLHVENHKQHRHDVKPHRIPSARIALRRDSALIGLQLRAQRRGCRPNELCQDQCYRGKRDHQRRVNQHRNVRALHHSLTRSILPPFSILVLAYFSNSNSPARLVAFTTALMSVTRSLPSSNSIIPSMVHPAGVVTASFSSAG